MSRDADPDATGASSPRLARRRTWLTLLAAALLFASGCVAAPGTVGSQTTVQFDDVTNSSGLSYQSTVSGAIGNGNEGVYVADVDRDGWEDVLVTGGDRPALFTNENGTFERSGQFTSLDDEYQAATFVDYDGDGWRDLLLFGIDNQTVTFHNDGGTFERTDVGLGNYSYPMGATATDFDGDGDQDLFVYQSGNWADGSPNGYFFITGFIENDNGNQNYFYENVDGEYRRVEDAGINGSHWSLAASAVDLNGDGATDVHVANDFYYDEAYVNQGNWTFEHRYLGNRTARNGMSSEVGDFDGDGSPDVFVTNIYLPIREELSPERYDRVKDFMQFVIKSGRTRGNSLLVNDGSGNLSDAAPEYGVQEGGWGWAASHSDYDNDGDRDLLHTTQRILQLDRSEPHYTYPMLWERTEDGFVNRDASEHGLKEADGRGMVTLDYDNDGELEVITSNYASNVTVYDNVGETANSLQFRVGSDTDDAAATGAVVTVQTGRDSTTVFQTDQTDFLSQESLVGHVGLGRAQTADLHVRWPDGTERTFEDVAADQRVRITRDGVETTRTFEE